MRGRAPLDLKHIRSARAVHPQYGWLADATGGDKAKEKAREKAREKVKAKWKQNTAPKQTHKHMIHRLRTNKRTKQ